MLLNQIEADLQQLARLIRDRREARGWSQHDLAYRAGVTQTMISRIETLKSSPSAHIYFSLLRILNIKIEYTPR